MRRFLSGKGFIPDEKKKRASFTKRSGHDRDRGNNQAQAEPYEQALSKARRKVKEELKNAPIVEQLKQENQEFEPYWASFIKKLESGFVLPHDEGGQTMSRGLVQAYKQRGIGGLEDRLKYAFYGLVTGSRFSKSDIINQKILADLRYPTEWFPATRGLQREIHLHVGPTNSGKTYHALQALEAAETGMYAGPLRLLAHEVYTRMNAKGKRCVLITGEERRSPDESTESKMVACTVEMATLSRPVDVAVVDEIQMIGGNERGWAWTQAVLGIQAKELHLCGEARTVPLLKELFASVGEKVQVHEYTRLSPLAMAEESLDGDLKKLRKGDCIVSFSVVGIHALRRRIEQQTKRKVATVYGSLPPETRAHQARLFNDPDNDYDYLVASDAIGMGLNLSVHKVVTSP